MEDVGRAREGELGEPLTNDRSPVSVSAARAIIIPLTAPMLARGRPTQGRGGKPAGKRGRTLRARTPLPHVGGGDDDADDARAMQCWRCRRRAGSWPCCCSAQLPLPAADDTKPPVVEEEEVPALLRMLTRCCSAAPAMATAAVRWGRWCGTTQRQTKPVATTRHADGPGRWQAGKLEF